MSGRKYVSGSQKRKLKEQKDTELSKFPKLTSFFQPKSVDVGELSNEVLVSEEVNVATGTGAELFEEEGENLNTAPQGEGLEVQQDGNEDCMQEDIEKLSEIRDNVNAGVNYSDLGFWPTSITSELVDFCLSRSFMFFQNKNETDSYPESKQTYKDQNRYFCNRFFNKSMKNGQTIVRSWLCYSLCKGAAFCLPCKLFSHSENTVALAFDGCKDWKNIRQIFTSHEESDDHKKAMMIYLTRKSNKGTIDKELKEQATKNQQYYYNILTRVVAAIKFLAQRGLPLRGHDEKWGSPQNGNFMGLMELISEFDPFLKEHLTKCQTGAIKSTTYLSKTVYEEIVQLMGKNVLQRIIEQIKEDDTKYYTLIVDSTPDIAHTDQLAIVLRYCHNGNIFERFTTFLQIENHTSETLFTKVSQFLNDAGLSFENIRGQSYDNASNMSGKYTGLQARIKEINALADFAPCAAHSLNLVGVEAVSVVMEMTAFFGTIQQIYNFFSASPHRWKILNERASLPFSLKTLSTTRWSSHYESVRAVKVSYQKILDTLKYIFDESSEKAECKLEAKGLYKRLTKRETAVLCIIWEMVLERINKVNKILQSPGLDICQGYALLHSVELFVKCLREDSEKKMKEVEETATELSTEVDGSFSDEHKRVRTKIYSDGEKGRDMLKGTDKFRVEVFNVLLDKLGVELEKRSFVYKDLGNKFNFLINLGKKNSMIEPKSMEAVMTLYKNDIGIELVSECSQFQHYLNMVTFNQNNSITAAEMLKLIFKESLIDIFPNLYTILKIYLTIPITSCEAERSFSKMAYIKNKYRSNMTDERLNNLSILSIEYDLTRSITYDEAIREYVSNKCRREKFF